MDKIKLAKKILKVLEANGYKGYFVGGFVRDLLLNREINDIDIATNAHPEQVMGLFLKTIPTGLKHGTITVLMNGIPFEVTTFRAEGKYLDFRHPSKVSFVASIEEDLSRRDFTMNAIALSINDELVDPFCGKEAIEKKIVKAVGNAEERFLEDPLRMLRAIRFAAQLDFAIEGKTWQAVIEKSSYIKHIAAERVKQELDKIITADYSEQGLILLRQSKLLKSFDKLKEINLDPINHFQYKNLSQTTDFYLRWSLFLYPLHGKELNAFMRAMKFSKKETTNINQIYQAYNYLKNNCDSQTITRCLIETGISSALKAVEMMYILGELDRNAMEVLAKKIEEIDKSTKVKKISDLAVTGTELIICLNQSGGPWLKQVLEELKNKVIYEGLENDKQILLHQAKIIYKGIENDGA